jgi:hypothetical protein
VLKRQTALIAILSLITIPIYSVNAAVKAGATCTKLNQTQVYKDLTFKCVKSGKKLIWDKGTKTVQQVVAKEGDTCQKMGQTVTTSSSILECRKIAGNSLSLVTITNNFSAVTNPASPDAYTVCRLADKRPVFPIGTLSIAYPPKPFANFKTATGKFKIVVVGIDFSDVQGTGDPSILWNSDIKKINEWLKWYSNDKVSFDFVTYPKWLRASKVSSAYDATNTGDKAPGAGQIGGLTSQQITDDYISVIEDSVDLSNTTGIWIYFPPNISKITGAFTAQTAGYQSKKYGLISAQLVTGSADLYLSKRASWAFYLHEIMHGFGIQGHSPKFLPANGFTRIGEMSTADGWSNALLPWDALIWGVEKPEDLYCIDKPHLTSVDLKLVPLEREQIGIRSAMVKLNDHQVLVVESHRTDKWGVGEGAGFAAVMVSVIDVKVSTSWDDERTARNPCTTSTGVYLKVDGANHGNHQPIGSKLVNNGQLYWGVGVINGVGIAGDYEDWDTNHLMYLGESIKVAGLKVSLISSGDNDTVRIENIDPNVSEFQQLPIPSQCK